MLYIYLQKKAFSPLRTAQLKDMTKTSASVNEVQALQ